MAYSDSIGAMTELVSLQSPPNAEGTRNTIGEPTGPWTTIAGNVWAEVKTAGGNEAVEGSQLVAVGTYIVRTRQRPDVDETCRVLWGSLDLRIQSIGRPEGQRSRFMTLVCLAAKAV